MPNFPSIYLELQELWKSVRTLNDTGLALTGPAGGILDGTYPDPTALKNVDGQPNIPVNGSLYVTGEITASNLSSSVRVEASSLTASYGKFTVLTASTGINTTVLTASTGINTNVLTASNLSSSVRIEASSLTASYGKFNNNLICSGNISFRDGKGIDFGAVCGPDSFNRLLDDYEEGRWTPTIRGSLSDGTDLVYGPSNHGLYIKVGNIVVISCTLKINSWAEAPEGSLTITNIPYSLSGTDGYQDSATMACYANGSVGSSYYGMLGGTSIILFRNDNTAADWSDFNFPVMINFSMAYTTD